MVFSFFEPILVSWAARGLRGEKGAYLTSHMSKPTRNSEINTETPNIVGPFLSPQLWPPASLSTVLTTASSSIFIGFIAILLSFYRVLSLFVGLIRGSRAQHSLCHGGSERLRAYFFVFRRWCEEGDRPGGEFFCPCSASWANHRTTARGAKGRAGIQQRPWQRNFLPKKSLPALKQVADERCLALL